jgi:hypothetical protein
MALAVGILRAELIHNPGHRAQSHIIVIPLDLAGSLPKDHLYIEKLEQMQGYLTGPWVQLADPPHWGISSELVILSQPHPPVKEANKEDLRARNRVASKKWRDRKDETLYQLEATNDQLRQEALRLRAESCALQTVNQVLDDEIKFFQSVMLNLTSLTSCNETQAHPALSFGG